jgi:hypothetical protein
MSPAISSGSTACSLRGKLLIVSSYSGLGMTRLSFPQGVCHQSKDEAKLKGRWRNLLINRKRHPRRPVLDSVQNAHIVPPGQLCNKLLHNWFLRPGLFQGTHVLEASGAEALDARKLVLEIMGKPVDNPGTPTLCSLFGEDIPANRPIEENQLAIDRERSTKLCGKDASF